MSVGVDPNVGLTVADLLLNRPRHLPQVRVQDVVRSTYLPGLDLLPAHESLYAADALLQPQPGWHRYLATALAPMRDQYDVIVIDTPPNIGTLAVNAAVASDGILAPLLGAAESRDSLKALLQKLPEWRQFTGSPLPIFGVLRAGWNGFEQKIERKVLAELQAIPEVRDVLLDTVIPNATVVRGAFGAKMDVGAFAPNSDAAVAYSRLVAELSRAIVATVA